MSEAPLKYRKRPVVVKAMQFDSSERTFAALKDWTAGAFRYESMAGPVIRTLENALHHVSHGDWIIRGIQGEFYACKPDIFAATYEPVNDTRAPRASEGEASVLRNLLDLLRDPHNASESFERVGEMYLADTGHLRPGKSA